MSDNQKLILGIVIIVISLVLLVGVGFSVMNRMESKKDNDASTDNNQTNNITPTTDPRSERGKFFDEMDGFSVDASYSEETKKWSYEVIGTLPNPCYKGEVTETIAESLPEQVFINVKVTEPPKDQVCAQVIQEFKKTGELQVSENATFNFEVTR